VRVLYVEFKGGENGVMDLLGDDFGGFVHQFLQVIQVDVFAHDDDVYLIAVDAEGQVADEVNGFGLAEVVDYLFDDFVHAHVFAYDAVDISKKRVLVVGPEYFSGFFKAVELEAYGVGALAKLSGQSTQIAGAAGVQEELQHELDAGFGGDEGLEHFGFVICDL